MDRLSGKNTKKLRTSASYAQHQQNSRNFFSIGTELRGMDFSINYRNETPKTFFYMAKYSLQHPVLLSFWNHNP